MGIDNKILCKELRGSPTWNSWASMVKRCTNPNNNRFHRYGGRGISVCSKWRSFAGFLDDMGEKPQGLTIERIDGNEGYFKGNCRWATYKEQANNKCNNHLIIYKGETMTLTQAAERYGIEQSALRGRLKRGWDTDSAIETPVRAYKAMIAAQGNEL